MAEDSKTNLDTVDFSAAAKAAQEKVEAEKDPRMGLPESVQVLEDQPAYDYSRTTMAEDPNGEYIEYTGVATVRTLGPDDWAAVHVSKEDGGDQYYEWNTLNKKRIARSVFSDAQLTYLLRVDGRFALVSDRPEQPASEDKQDN